MKKTLLLLLFTTFATAQNHDFKIENSQVIWTHIFTDTVSVEPMANQILKFFPHTRSQNTTSKYLSGSTDYADLINNKKGLNGFWRQPVKFNYTVYFKEGKYRVLINNITFKSLEISVYGVTNSSDTMLDDSFIRNDGTFRKNKMYEKIMQELHQTFMQRFTYKTDSDW